MIPYSKTPIDTSAGTNIPSSKDKATLRRATIAGATTVLQVSRGKCSFDLSVDVVREGPQFEQS
jgi:hypothetical protein